jgi:ribonuclease VapC
VQETSGLHKNLSKNGGMKSDPESFFVFDASALLALFFSEAGSDDVRALIQRTQGLVTIVNDCEVLTKVHEVGFPLGEFETVFSTMPLTLVDANKEMARYAAALRPSTKHAGLSLGDRFCLAGAFYYHATAVTADRSWKEIKAGVPVICIR